MQKTALVIQMGFYWPASVLKRLNLFHSAALGHSSWWNRWSKKPQFCRGSDNPGGIFKTSKNRLGTKRSWLWFVGMHSATSWSCRIRCSGVHLQLKLRNQFEGRLGLRSSLLKGTCDRKGRRLPRSWLILPRGEKAELKQLKARRRSLPGCNAHTNIRLRQWS